MATTAKVIADSISESGQRLTTLVLEYPRIVHSEVMTHRMFSRNASSSRAIPVEKQIERIKKEPFVPQYWGANQKGMQASEEISESGKNYAKEEWLEARDNAVYSTQNLLHSKVHKQLANRLLEPFSHIQVVVTATEWDNFFLQRLDKNAQPEIQDLAKVMSIAMNASKPTKLSVNQWHLPFVDEADKIGILHHFTREFDGIDMDFKPDLIHKHMKAKQEAIKAFRKVSVARCARVSYGLNERGWGDVQKDLDLYEMLAAQYHMSPFEHIATPMLTSQSSNPTEWEVGITHLHRDLGYFSGNFAGWLQYRQIFEQSKSK